MILGPYTTTLFATGVLTGIAVAVLASMVPEIPQVVRDLRERGVPRPDSPGDLAVERAISRRFYRALLPLSGIVVLAVAGVLFSL
jgi:hypothetical protein